MWTALQRSAARAAAPVMLAVIAAHLALRSRAWTHEWMWAVYQFGFVTILLGPLVAGVAAWEGWRLSTSADLLATGTRPKRAVLLAWSATLVWSLLAYSVGLAAVAVLVKLAGTPGWPDPSVLIAALPPVGLLAAEAGAGLLTGWWLRHALAAPAAAIGCFLVSLWLYTAGPSQFITVGGATASLVGLAPRPSLESAQLLCYLVAAATALLVTARPRPRAGIPVAAADRGPLLVSGVLLVAAGGLLLSHHETPLHAVPADTRCVGSAPAVCVAPGYLADAPSARAALLPALERLQSAGAPVPARFVQGALPGARSVGPLEATFLLGDHSDAAFLVVNAYLSKNCFSTGSTRLEDEWSALVGWLDPRAAKGGSEAGLPAVALGPSTPAQRLWVRRVVADLSACGR